MRGLQSGPFSASSLENTTQVRTQSHGKAEIRTRQPERPRWYGVPVDHGLSRSKQCHNFYSYRQISYFGSLTSNCSESREELEQNALLRRPGISARYLAPACLERPRKPSPTYVKQAITDHLHLSEVRCYNATPGSDLCDSKARSDPLLKCNHS